MYLRSERDFCCREKMKTCLRYWICMGLLSFVFEIRAQMLAERIDNNDNRSEIIDLFSNLAADYFADKIAILSITFENDYPLFWEEDNFKNYIGVLTARNISVAHYILSAEQPGVSQILIKEYSSQKGSQYGYIITSKTTINIKKILDALAIINFDQNIIVVSPTNVSSLLVENWTNNRMMNILGVEKSDNMTAKISEFEVHCYNPFLMRQNRRGYVRVTKVTINNYREEIYNVLSDMKNRLLDVHGYPIRICIFEIPGQVRAIKNSNGTIIDYVHLNAEIVWLMLSASNFGRQYVSPPPGSFFGGKVNGKATGLVWVLEQEMADIAGNLRMMQDFDLVNSTFLYSIEEQVYVFMTPKLGFANRVTFLLLGLGNDLYLRITIL